MTMIYTTDQWIFFFFIYCFFGWMWESSFVSIRTKKLTNRGFMRGPFIPIYGCGCVLMMAVGAPLMAHPIAMYFTGMICATVMEFITGDMMLRIFRVRYWDYTGRFLNIKGHVCLAASILWGFFTLLMNYVGKIPIERKVMMIPPEWLHVIVLILLVYFVADFSLSFKTALDLRDVIIAMERFRDEMERMEKRMDVMIAFADDAKNQAVEAITEKVEEKKEQAKIRLEERMDEMEKKLEFAKEKLADMYIRDELETKRQEFLSQISEYRVRNELMRTRIRESAQRRGALYRNMIRNNILYSDRFKDSLDEIRQKVEDFSRDKKGGSKT